MAEESGQRRPLPGVPGGALGIKSLQPYHSATLRRQRPSALPNQQPRTTLLLGCPETGELLYNAIALGRPALTADLLLVKTYTRAIARL